MEEDIKSKEKIWNDLTKFDWLDDLYRQQKMLEKYPELLKVRNTNNLIKHSIIKKK